LRELDRCRELILQEREMWKRIKIDEANHLREKKERYGLHSNREARLYCAPHSRNGT
jgi:hypothetical protein